jgi:iron complex transport system ATP-binding protein
MVSTQPYFEAEALEVWLGGRPVFSNLSLRLMQGEHTVVLGPNGSGKSSLLKLLSRELYPVVKPGSSLRIFGESSINLWELRRRIGHVSQDLQMQVPPLVKASDLVLSGCFGSVGLAPRQRVTNQQRQRLQQLLELFNLADLAECPFAQLSEGQKRRLLLARALVHEPQLLVLDEPTNGLDLAARHLLLQSLRQLTSSGTTLLLVTHQMDAIIPVVERAVLLKGGMVVGDGAAADLLCSHQLSALFDAPLRLVQAAGWRQLLPTGDAAGS